MARRPRGQGRGPRSRVARLSQGPKREASIPCASSQEIGAYFALIASVLEEGVTEGRFRSGLPVKVATKMLFGAMDQVATSWVLGKRGYQLVDTADAVAEIFLQGVAAPTS